MAEKNPTDRSDAMEHDLERLDDHISDAEKKLEARRKDAANDVNGDDDGDGRVDDEVANPT